MSDQRYFSEPSGEWWLFYDSLKDSPSELRRWLEGLLEPALTDAGVLESSAKHTIRALDEALGGQLLRAPGRDIDLAMARFCVLFAAQVAPFLKAEVADIERAKLPWPRLLTDPHLQAMTNLAAADYSKVFRAFIGKEGPSDSVRAAFRTLPFEDREKIVSTLGVQIEGDEILRLEGVNLPGVGFDRACYGIFSLPGNLPRTILLAACGRLGEVDSAVLQGNLRDAQHRHLVLRYAPGMDEALLDTILAGCSLGQVLHELSELLENLNADTLIEPMPGLRVPSPAYELELPWLAAVKARLAEYAAFRIVRAEHGERQAVLANALTQQRGDWQALDALFPEDLEPTGALRAVNEALIETCLSDEFSKTVGDLVLMFLRDWRYPQVHSRTLSGLLEALAERTDELAGRLPTLALYIEPAWQHKDPGWSGLLPEGPPAAIGRALTARIRDASSDAERLWDLVCLGRDDWGGEQLLGWLAWIVDFALQEAQPSARAEPLLAVAATHGTECAEIWGKRKALEVLRPLLPRFGGLLARVPRSDGLQDWDRLARCTAALGDPAFDTYLETVARGDRALADLLVLKALREYELSPGPPLERLKRSGLLGLGSIEHLAAIGVAAADLAFAVVRAGLAEGISWKELWSRLQRIVIPDAATPPNAGGDVWLGDVGVDLLTLVVRDLNPEREATVGVRFVARLLLFAPLGIQVDPAAAAPWLVFSRESLDRVRRMLRGTEALDPSAFDDESLFAAAVILGRMDDWWRGLKPLLLAFRFLPENTLKGDLDVRHGTFGSRFACVPRTVHRYLDRWWGEEEGENLRRNLATYFADSLKPLKPLKGTYMGGPRSLPDNRSPVEGYDPGYVEPDPVWRYAYVRAIRDLEVKTTRDGHFLSASLRMAEERDPSPQVRRESKRTADELDRLRTGEATGSHKRRLLHAWWWLRRAHLLVNDGQFDKEGADRTRATEVR